ncbi:MAG: hypothetical protein ACFBWO_17435, partial [Paracoccaceae bacterium]
MSSRLPRRTLGVALLATVAVPPLLVVGALAIAGHATVRLAGTYHGQIQRVAAIVQDEIAPRLDGLRRDADALAVGVARFQDEAQRALSGLTDIPDLTIARGQLGTTPQLRVRVPFRDVRLAEAPAGAWPAVSHGDDGLVWQRAVFGGRPKIPNPGRIIPNPGRGVPNPGQAVDSLRVEVPAGRLFDQTLPSQAIPPRALTLTTAPLRQAFAPVAQGVERAVATARQPFDRVVAGAASLGEPLGRLRDEATAVVHPIGPFLSAMTVAAALVAGAVLVSGLTYAGAAAWMVARRPREAGAALLAGGPFGFVGAVGAMLRRSAVRLLTAKAAETTPAARRPAPADARPGPRLAAAPARP